MSYVLRRVVTASAYGWDVIVPALVQLGISLIESTPPKEARMYAVLWSGELVYAQPVRVFWVLKLLCICYCDISVCDKKTGPARNAGDVSPSRQSRQTDSCVLQVHACVRLPTGKPACIKATIIIVIAIGYCRCTI